jgi:hypothetical protein
MGTIKGFLVTGTRKGVKYFYLPTTKTWTEHLGEVRLSDISQEKIEINMNDYPDMDHEYLHEGISIDSNTDY